jgi:hypothetical protein
LGWELIGKENIQREAKIMEWNKKELDKETDELQPKSEDEMIINGVKRGRPSRSNTVKTNLDLSIEVIMELDQVAEFIGSTRQSIIKGFILNGLKDFHLARDAKVRIVKS